MAYLKRVTTKGENAVITRTATEAVVIEATKANGDGLTFAELDRIVSRGKADGVFRYQIKGGESLARSGDVALLRRRHPDCKLIVPCEGKKATA